MSDNVSIARFVREHIVEPESIARARAAALELGAAPLSAEVGAEIALLAATVDAKTIIELGTGGGVSGLWLLHGSPDAVLTSIDNEAEHISAARQAFHAARVPTARARFITGRATDVLTRMNEGAYDLVLIDADAENVIEYVEHGLRLARPGGVVLVPRIFAGGRVADPVQRDALVRDYRTLVSETLASSAVLASLSTTGEGLLNIVKR